LRFLLGIGLLVIGVILKRRAYVVTAQTLVSTGVLILYAATYAAHGFYHSSFSGVLPTFLLMTLITLAAFVLAVALNRRWFFLTPLAAAGTVLLQLLWIGEFFRSERYDTGNKVLIPMTVLLGFGLLYLAANGVAKRRGPTNRWLSAAALGLLAVALGLTPFFLSVDTLSPRRAGQASACWWSPCSSCSCTTWPNSRRSTALARSWPWP
jgi:uncharacterized membrane protein